MTWYTYALIAAVLIAITTLIEKRTLQVEHAMEFSTIFACINLCLSIPFFFLIDYAKLDMVALGILFLASILSAVSLLYSTKGLRHMAVSESTPLYVIAPALTAILATIFLGEFLSLQQTGGLVILLVGAYILELRGTDLLAPFREFRQSKYIHLILISILLMSISAVIERMLLSDFNMQAEALLAFVHLFLALIFLTMYRYSYGKISLLRDGVRKYGIAILLIGILTVLHRYAQIESAKLAFIGLVAALKRSSTFFIVIIGGRLFKEDNLLMKVFACVVMILGMAIIIL